MIDAFASAYRWSKRTILEEVYPEEVPLLIKRIGERKKQEKLDQIDHWLMLLDIATAAISMDRSGVAQLYRNLKDARSRIEKGRASQERFHDIEFHKGLLELNRRRRSARKGA